MISWREKKMIEPRKDRLEYGKLLIPPEGYSLDFAVGTTYSLDLETFILICNNLENKDDNIDNVSKLSALQKVNDNIVVFCQKGQIKCPQKTNQLFSLLENSVREINTKETFHPKTWIIKYKKEQEYLYRLIVLSRNLTFDKSWDIAVATDGRKVNDSQLENNKPLIDFVGVLKKNYGNSKDEKYTKITSLVKELEYVVFETDKKMIKQEFVPLGKCFEYKSNHPLFIKNKKIKELIVVSPFLSKGIIKELNDRFDTKDNNTRPILITRRESLYGLKQEDIPNFDIYQMRDEVVFGESDNTNKKETVEDIHAKMFFIRTDRCNELYVGSMNSTHNAMYNNYEFMMKFQGRYNYLSADILKKQLFGEDETKSPFERVYIEEIKEEEKEEENLDVILKDICSIKMSAKVEEQEDKYKIIITSKNEIIKEGMDITISPLYSNIAKEIAKTITFEDLKLNELSQWYTISIKGLKENLKRIVFIPTDNIPKDRYTCIIENIISNRETFFKYVSYILADNPYEVISNELLNRGRKLKGQNKNIIGSGLYEEMLKIAATDPERLKSIEYVIENIKRDEIVPPNFRELYDIFTKVKKKNDGKH